jgi:hypothetical protein
MFSGYSLKRYKRFDKERNIKTRRIRREKYEL